MSLPVVALHGFAGGPACWFATLEILRPRSRRRRFILPILPGHEPRATAVRDEPPHADVEAFSFQNCSRATRMPPTFDQQAARLCRELRARGAGPFHLVGYSLGARWALALLAREPALFASTLLLSGHTGLPSESQRSNRRAADERWCRQLQRSLEAFFRAWEAQPLLRATENTSLSYLRARRAIRQTLRPAGLTASLRHSGLGAMPDLSCVLASRRQPIRILLGASDQRFRELYESSRLRASLDIRNVPGAGHDLLGQAPSAVAQAALDLWAECEVPVWGASRRASVDGRVDPATV